PFATAPRSEAPQTAPLTVPEQAAPAATAPTAPVLEAPAALPSAATALTPLPAPAPLPATVQPLAAQPPAQRTAPVLRRELPETPQEAFNIAVDTAGDAIDTIIDWVQTVTMNRPPSRPMASRQAVPEPVAAL